MPQRMKCQSDEIFGPYRTHWEKYMFLHRSSFAASKNGYNLSSILSNAERKTVEMWNVVKIVSAVEPSFCKKFVIFFVSFSNFIENASQLIQKLSSWKLE